MFPFFYEFEEWLVNGLNVHGSILKTGGREYDTLNGVKNKVVRIL
jgi:hypothetical protein